MERFLFSNKSSVRKLYLRDRRTQQKMTYSCLNQNQQLNCEHPVDFFFK